MTVDDFLRLVQDRGASDLHIASGYPPTFRLRGRLEPIRFRMLGTEEFEGLVRPIVPEHAWERFMETGEADFAHDVEGVARFRVNVFLQERGPSAVFRAIPSTVFGLDELGLPPVLSRLTQLRSGLVLVTGPTGSGKSTTLASIINEINIRRAVHIISIEDPIEFLHESRKAMVSQREIGTHAESFPIALRAALREDPDIIMVGEMRDPETVAMTVNAAETGHLVFGTLHTNSAGKTLDRMINTFPGGEQARVRSALSSVVSCVLSQQLLPTVDGAGRVAGVEILFGSPALGTMIRAGKTHLVHSLIQSGAHAGMITMDESLRQLLADGLVSPQDVLEKCIDKDEMIKWMREHAYADVPPDVI